MPRPIALVTTISADGAINSAPYSLFNVMGHDPAVVMIFDDRYVLDATRGVIDTPELKLFGGMHGARWYAKLSDRFAMDAAMLRSIMP